MVHGSLFLRVAEAAKKAPVRPRLRKAAIELTDSAIARIKELLKNREKVGFSAFWLLVVVVVPFSWHSLVFLLKNQTPLLKSSRNTYGSA